MSEWRLYRPLAAFWEDRGFHTASQVTDPGGSRWEVDVVAFTTELEDVRVTEVKLEASGSLVNQCLDRLEMAPRVYAALPAGEAAAFGSDTADGEGQALGVLAVQQDGSVEVLRPATPRPDRRREGRAQVLERQLRGQLL